MGAGFCQIPNPLSDVEAGLDAFQIELALIDQHEIVFQGYLLDVAATLLGA